MLRLKKFWSLIFLGIVFVILQASPLLASVPLSTFDAGLREYLSGYDYPKFLYDQRGNRIEEPPDGILDDGEIANITGIDKYWGTKISSLNGVSKLFALKILHCVGNNLSSINLGGLPITDLSCGHNKISSMNVGGLSVLEKLWCENNNLSSLNVSSNMILQELGCSENNLTSLNVSRNAALQKLHCNNNQLTMLDVSNNKNLYDLECSGNKITKLDLSGNKNLRKLYCDENELEELILNDNASLTKLFCWNNHLTELDLSHTSVGSVSLSDQHIYGLKVQEITNEYGIRRYKVNLSDYVKKLENIDPKAVIACFKLYKINDKDEYALYRIYIGVNSSPSSFSYNKSTGEILLPYRPYEIRYRYNTNAPSKAMMDVILHADKEAFSVEALGNGAVGYEVIEGIQNNCYVRKYLDEGDLLDERKIARFDYSNKMGKLGFAADGLSRLIIRANSTVAGYITCKINDNIGVKVETLQRGEVLPSTQIRTAQYDTTWPGNNSSQFGRYQASVILVAPDGFPASKKFPSDTFSVTVDFHGDDGTFDTQTLNLKIETPPVVLIPGMLNNGSKTFGRYKNNGVWRALRAAGYTETDHIRIWDNDGQLGRGPSALLANGYNGLYKTLDDIFTWYAQRGITCTRADIVAFGMGGLMARKFLEDIELKDNHTRYGDNWTLHSYRQGMVRRVITIAAPHRGTPWADSSDGRSFITTMYNAILDSPFYYNHPNCEAVLQPFILLANTVVGFSPYIFKNADIANRSGWDDARTDAPRDYGFPSKVPMYSIVGEIHMGIAGGKDIFSVGSTILEKTTGINIDLKNYWGFSGWLLEKDLFYRKFGIKGLWRAGFKVLGKFCGVFGLIYDLPSYARALTDTFATAVFGLNKPNDLIVSTSSAVGDFEGHCSIYQVPNNELLDAQDKYAHWSICQQDDVGNEVAALLKGPVSKFKVFGSNYNASTARSANMAMSSASNNSRVLKSLSAYKSFKSEKIAETDDDDIENWEEFNFTEALNLKVEPSSFKLSGNEDTVTFSLTAEEPMEYDVYCAFSNGNNLWAFKMPASDDTKKTFKAVFDIKDIFASVDVGLIDINCFARDPNGIETSIYTSNIVNIAALPDEASINITKLEFADGLASIQTNIDSETELELYAFNYDGKIYDISSPLMGTEFKFDDPSIAQITDSGTIEGLKVGSTKLTASYRGASADITVIVGETETQEPQDPEEPVIAPEITTSSNLSVGTVNTSYSVTLSADGTTPISWTVSADKLPDGLRLNESTGVITGTPEKSGTFNFTVQASNSAGTDTREFSIIINDVKPVINTASLPVGTVGTSYNATLSATGQNITWSGNSVNGLKVNSNGTITGVPSKSGTYKITVTAKNSGGSVSKTLSIVINDVKPVIKTSSLANGTTGTSYNVTLSATGLNITWSGNSINGLTVNSNGKITGTPTKAGTYKITVTAKNSGGSVSKTLSVVINDVKPVIKTSSLANGTTGTSYTATLSATGQNITWSGNSINGLTVNSNGKITGTPTKSGTYKITVTAKNSGGSVSKTLSVVIKDVKPVIKTSSLSNGMTGTSYNATLSATGGNVKWSISSGKLPTGLKLTASTGKITGKPTKAGTFSFKITAKNSIGSAVKTLKIVIKDAKPVIKTTSLNSGTVNKTYSATLKATGTNIKWSISGGKLPTGLKLTASTGKITGKPTKAGTFSFKVTAKSSTSSAVKTLKIVIKDAKPVIKTTSLSSGTINKTYSATLKATGTNIKWSISSGKLPTGLKLTASTGKITGKPTKAGTFSFTVTAKNSGGSVKKALKITIAKTKTASIAEFFNIFKVANDNNYEVENELDDVTPNDDLENSGENPEIDEEISNEENLENPENSENSVEREITDNDVNAELTLVNSDDVNVNINADDEIYAASSTDLIFKIGTWTDVNGNNIEPEKIHVYVNDELDENINVKDNMFEIFGISDDINVYVKADAANAELKSNTVFVTTDYNNIDSSNENGNSSGENSHANSNGCNAANSKFLIVLVVTAAFIKKFRFQNLR